MRRRPVPRDDRLLGWPLLQRVAPLEQFDSGPPEEPPEPVEEDES